MKNINEFLELFPNKETKRQYRCHLNTYFKTIQTQPENYFQKDRDYEQDVTQYWQTIQKYAPLTRTAKISAIRGFLEENNIELSSRFWKKLSKRSKGKRAITIDAAPSNTQLKRILSHADEMTRAVTLIGCSSGLRINEILNLHESDIKPNGKLLRIYIRPEISKTGETRVTFATDEAKQALQEWMKVRYHWLKSSLNKGRGVLGYNGYENRKTIDDPRVFPIDYSCFNRKWSRCLKKAGLNERDVSTGYHKYHIHTLRKFFETRMSTAGVPEAIIQQLQGHTGYLNGSYKRYMESELEQAYNTGKPLLMIFESAENLSGITNELDRLRQEREEDRKVIMELRLKILEVKNGIN